MQKLDHYKEKIKQLGEKYAHVYGPDSTWWIVGMADQRMRSERLERIRQRAEEKHVMLMSIGQLQLSKFNEKKPWDSVFLMAAEDRDFW